MPLVNMRDMLDSARKGTYAVAAFNIFNHITAAGAVRAAEEARAPLILQTSTSTVRAFGPEPLFDMLSPLAKRASIPVAIHLDHCTDPDMASACLRAGWTSVMLDASRLPFGENVAATGKIAREARNRGATVEGELGAIGGVEDDIVAKEDESSLTDPDKALEFCLASGVDAFAPSIGTAHGLYKGEPVLRYDLLASIASRSPCPVVVHGGTGLTAEQFRKLVESGASKINVSTAVKMAYMDTIRGFAGGGQQSPDPLAFDRLLAGNISSLARDFIRMFGSEGKAI